MREEGLYGGDGDRDGAGMGGINGYLPIIRLI